jgi:hypothetical protein
MPIVRHFLLKVGAPAEARKLLGRLVSGDVTPGTASSSTSASVTGIRPENMRIEPLSKPTGIPRKH